MLCLSVYASTTSGFGNRPLHSMDLSCALAVDRLLDQDVNLASAVPTSIFMKLIMVPCLEEAAVGFSMSLFAGIFGSAGPAAGVFGANSAYRAKPSSQAGDVPAPTAEASADRYAEQPRKRKRAAEDVQLHYQSRPKLSDHQHDNQKHTPSPAATKSELRPETPAKKLRTSKERTRTTKAVAEVGGYQADAPLVPTRKQQVC